jgi:ParB family transcriptional regulator, chromosome partitioning protein
MTTTADTSVRIMDPETAPDGVLGAFNAAELDLSANARKDAESKVTPDDVASARAMATLHDYGCGNAQPVEIRRRPDGTLRVRDGARRTLMCLGAGVPVFGFIAGPEGDETADARGRLITQWFANHHHEAPAATDDNQLMLDLFATGMTEAGIAKALGRKRPEVKTRLAVARSKLGTALADKYPFMDMAQCAAIEEFDSPDCAEMVKGLVAAAKTGNFDHVLARYRLHRRQQAEEAAFVAELEAAGYHIRTEGWVGWQNLLSNLRTPDGAEISPDDHETCPGRGVTITWTYGWRDAGARAAYATEKGIADGEPVIFDGKPDTKAAETAGWIQRWLVERFLCTDPLGNGHTNVRGSLDEADPVTPAQLSDQETADAAEQEKAAKSAARSAMLKRNREWRAYTELRVAHLTGLCGKRKLTAPMRSAATVLAALAAARGEVEPQKMGESHRLAAKLLGLGGGEGDDRWASGRELITAEIERSGPDRALVCNLAMVLASVEGEDGTWGSCADVHTWQRAGERPEPGSRTARYLAWLVRETGYKPSELELMVMTAGGLGPQPPDGDEPGDGDQVAVHVDPDPALADAGALAKLAADG